MQNLAGMGKSPNYFNKDSHKGPFARRERSALLQKLGHDRGGLMRDVEDALHELNAFHSVDQHRVAAIIEHDAVQHWILDLESQALLVHGNCRRDEILSPTSAATAMLIRELFDRFSEKTSKVTLLYWFCGLHITGVHGTVLGMVRSFICQLLSRSFVFDITGHKDVVNGNLEESLDLYLVLLRQLPEESTVICFIDGVSFYEGSLQQGYLYKVVREVARMVKSERICFKFFMTSPKRTSYLLEDPTIAKRVRVVEMPQHVNGPRQGF